MELTNNRSSRDKVRRLKAETSVLASRLNNAVTHKLKGKSISKSNSRRRPVNKASMNQRPTTIAKEVNTLAQ